MAEEGAHVRFHQPGFGPSQQRQTFVLLFDGTGNKFSGTEADSCILKILRLLDRNDSAQRHYYQPGIGTYVQSSSYNHTSTVMRAYSWLKKQRDQAIGSSFAEHVMGGYKFLMRFYKQGDDIYIFGFSRGAYTARFLAEMLDYIGLLEPGNEELARFAWKAFARWQRRLDTTDEEKEEKRKMFHFLKAFRDTFSRPVRRIRFLGLFDTVNSVPHFETAFLQRSKFPYTAKSSALVIRHAVSIDERRAKFRQDLVSGSRQKADADLRAAVKEKQEEEERVGNGNGKAAGNGGDKEERRATSRLSSFRGRAEKNQSKDKHASLAVPNGTSGRGAKGGYGTTMSPDSTRYRRPSRATSARRASSAVSRGRSESPGAPGTNQIPEDARSLDTDVSQVREDDDAADEALPQDIMEVWFPGEHSDIGGGWSVGDDEVPQSHVTLCWMVREAQRAGLRFDPIKMEEMKCGWDVGYDDQSAEPRERNPTIPEVQISKTGDPEILNEGQGMPTRARSGGQGRRESESHAKRQRFHKHLHRAQTESTIHDSLQFGRGLAAGGVLTWRFMEWLPFRRMDLQADGSWKPINWPLPRGEVRDIPDTAWIHSSALRRMEVDKRYRPGNLIVGGGGRGVRIAPEKYGIGEWEVVHEKGDPVSECVVRVRNGENGEKMIAGAVQGNAVQGAGKKEQAA